MAAALQAASTIGALVNAQTIRRHHEQAVATIGHEIRQPLSALVTALDLVERMASNMPAAPIRAAQRQAVHLVRLVDSLLDVSRVLGGSLRLKRRVLDLRGILSVACESIRGDVARKNQDLRVAVPTGAVWCVGDEERLREVAVNLLTNAHRYTPDGGTIQVTASQSADGTAAFSVRDTGVGIDAEERERLFKPFGSRSGAANGLGLAISFGIVEAHGGVITGNSNAPDAGSTFRVTLPGLLGRTSEIYAAVQRTKVATRTLVARARALRAKIQATSDTKPDPPT
jgi:signal transduction histidine kinase